MARPKNQTPTHKLHSSTGLARYWVGGKWVTLGRYGSPESRPEFARVLAPAGARLTVDQALLAFLAHAERHYRGPDGRCG